MNRHIRTDYFYWLCDIVCGERFSGDISYNKLLSTLHDIEFTYSITNDGNRAKDGIGLRWKYCLDNSIDYDEAIRYLAGPCSVLEMMVSLSIDCEAIMDDPQIGDRTGQWFWGMIANLGLRAMFDSNFNEGKVIKNIEIFLNHEYEPDGRGGLFTIKNIDTDLRKVEIWYQLCWYIDSIYM